MKTDITWPTRLVALSFILLIVMTNVWLHYHLFGGELPKFAHVLIDFGFAGVLLGGSAQCFLWLRKFLVK